MNPSRWLRWLFNVGIAWSIGFTTTTFGQSLPQQSIDFQYDNDLFTQTDQYYTQGIRWQYTSSQLKRFFLNRMLLKLPNQSQMGNTRTIKLQHAVFTPTNLGVALPLRNDRPYAGYLTLAYAQQQIDTLHQQILMSGIQIGSIGRPAFAEGMQKTIHDVVNSEQPQGWDNQIAPEALLGYQLYYQKAILGKIQRSHLHLFGQINLGNLLTSALVGVGFQLKNRPKARLRWQLSGSTQIQWIGHNATLQGGLFNRSSPHTFTPQQIKRGVVHHQLGGMIGIGQYQVGYAYHLISPEFVDGDNHRWGSLKMRVEF
ncbi:MAG TPA: hypothetical protein DCS93_07720 [Microscillaceae bacterium]|nr:hypothetical protein [Microscillaceae bacterium]